MGRNLRPQNWLRPGVLWQFRDGPTGLGSGWVDQTGWSRPGAVYQLECARDLTAPVWREVGGPIASGGWRTGTMVGVDSREDQRFYRVIER